MRRTTLSAFSALLVLTAFVGVARATDPANTDQDSFQRALRDALVSSPAPPPATRTAERPLRTPLRVGELYPADGASRPQAFSGHFRAIESGAVYAATTQAVDEVTQDAWIRANTTSARAAEVNTILSTEAHEAAVAEQRFRMVTEGIRITGEVADGATYERREVLDQMDRSSWSTFDMASRTGHEVVSLNERNVNMASGPLGQTLGGLWVWIFDPSSEDKEQIRGVRDERIAQNREIQAAQGNYLAGLDQRIVDLRALQGEFLQTGTAPIVHDQARKARELPRLRRDDQ